MNITVEEAEAIVLAMAEKGLMGRPYTRKRWASRHPFEPTRGFKVGNAKWRVLFRIMEEFPSLKAKYENCFAVESALRYGPFITDKLVYEGRKAIKAGADK